MPAASRTSVGAGTVEERTGLLGGSHGWPGTGLIAGSRGLARWPPLCENNHKHPATATEASEMTEQKPPKVSWETWIERKIRESMERGEFDNLPGHGEPIPDLARPYDELWWLRKKVRDEGLSIEPPAFTLRRQLDDTQARIAAAGGEAEVRRLVAAINERIVYVNSHITFGPPSDIVPLDVERVVAEWRGADPTGGSGAGGGSAG
jgi:hypothetical protein